MTHTHGIPFILLLFILILLEAQGGGLNLLLGFVLGLVPVLGIGPGVDGEVVKITSASSFLDKKQFFLDNSLITAQCTNKTK